MTIDLSKELLSVIVPIYNTDKYLKKCIASIINQTYTNLEIILVNDGSTDGSVDICEFYKKIDNRICIIHKKNQGLILARMDGLKNAHGKYVTFVDSDDFIDLNLFKYLMQPLIKNQDIDMCISSYLVHDNGKDIATLKKGKATELDAETTRRLMFENEYFNWSLCAKVYKTKLFKNIRISNITNAYGEDTEFNWKILKRIKKVYYIPFAGYHYRKNLESMTNKNISLAQFCLLDRYEKIIYDNDVKDFKTKNLIKTLLCRFGSNYIISYIKLNGEYTSIEKYQSILKKIFISFQKNLTPYEKKQCQLAILNGNKLHNLIKKNTDKIIDAYNRLYKKSKNIFIYGAGVIGKDIAGILKNYNLLYMGFVVSNKTNEDAVFSFDEIYNKYQDDCAFMIAMNENNVNEVKKFLKDINYICVGKYSLYD